MNTKDYQNIAVTIASLHEVLSEENFTLVLSQFARDLKFNYSNFDGVEFCKVVSGLVGEDLDQLLFDAFRTF